jgi:ATP-dependent DNA helicase RecG
VKTSVKMPVEILRLLPANSSMTLAEFAAEISKTPRAVELATSKLVTEGKLKYVGPQKGGHWEVLT